MSATSENTRLETFCDGVFAIALTLLILEIKVPPLSSVHSISDLWDALGRLWTSYVAFLLSFVIIFIGWIGHHAVFKIINRSSPQFLYANGFFLLTVVILPFLTALVAEYINTPYAQPAISLYCFGGLFNSLGWNLLFITAYRPVNLVKNEEAMKMFVRERRGVRSGIPLYVAVSVLSFWFPKTAFGLNTLSWIVWLVVGIVWQRKKKE